MEVNLIRGFRAIYEEKSYTKAANRLYMSRQAMQYLVKSLEREYGTPLFVKRANGIEPTPFAQSLYENSTHALQAWERMERSVESFNKERQLRIGVPSGVHASCTPEELNACLSSRYPCQITYEVCGELEAEKRLIKGDLDMAYMIIPARELGEIEYCCLSQGELFFLTKQGGPQGDQTAVSVSCLKDIPFIAQGLEYGGFRLLDRACRKQGFSLTPAFCTPDWYTIFNQVVMGNQVSYYPQNLTGKKGYSDVRTIPFKEKIVWRMAIGYLKEKASDPFIKQYVQNARQGRTGGVL